MAGALGSSLEAPAGELGRVAAADGRTRCASLQMQCLLPLIQGRSAATLLLPGPRPT